MLITGLEIESVTLGVSLRECSSRLPATARARIYDKIRRSAGHLARCVEDVVSEYGGSVRKVTSAVNPIATLFDGFSVTDYVGIAEVLDRAADDCGLDEVSGFSARCPMSLSSGDQALLRAIPQAIASTRHVCASVELGRSERGINIAAIERFCEALDSSPEAVLRGGPEPRIALLANASGSSPYLPAAFHGIDEPDVTLKIGVDAAAPLSQLVRIVDAEGHGQRMERRLRDLRLRLQAGAEFLGEKVAAQLARRAGTHVSLDRVDVGLANGAFGATPSGLRSGLMGHPERGGPAPMQRLVAIWVASSTMARIDRQSLELAEHRAGLSHILLGMLTAALENRTETEIVIRPRAVT